MLFLRILDLLIWSFIFIFDFLVKSWRVFLRVFQDVQFGYWWYQLIDFFDVCASMRILGHLLTCKEMRGKDLSCILRLELLHLFSKNVSFRNQFFWRLSLFDLLQSIFFFLSWRVQLLDFHYIRCMDNWKPRRAFKILLEHERSWSIIFTSVAGQQVILFVFNILYGSHNFLQRYSRR